MVSKEFIINTADRASRLHINPIYINWEHIPVLPLRTRMLDLGSGQSDSPFIDYLMDKNPKTKLDIVRLDYFEENIATYTRNGIIADAAELPFKDNSFPIILSSEITKNNIYFYTDGPLNAMASEIGRVLSPGGLYLVYNEHAGLVTPPGLQPVHESVGKQGQYKGLLYGVYKKPINA